MKTLIVFRLYLIVCLSYVLVSPLSAATYYTAKTGNDTTGDGSSTKPYSTIGRGMNRLAGGDTLIVRAGVYTDVENFINSGRHPLANGTAAAPTKIMAETPFSVRIKDSKPPTNYYDYFIRLEDTKQYVHIDGFILESITSDTPSEVVVIEGNFNKLTRCIVSRKSVTDQYGGWVYLGGNDNLIEDIAGVGSARYGFSSGGPDAVSQRNIMRRCVGRIDYSISKQPKATFNVYGNNDGTNVRDFLLQNCIAIDGRQGMGSSPTSEATYGGFYFPKNAYGVTLQGCIVLNVEAEYSGYFVREQQGANIKMEHCIAWAGYGNSNIAGIRANSGAPGFLTFDHLTIGNYRTCYFNGDSATSRTLRNTFFSNNNARTTSSDSGWTTVSHNAFIPAVQAIGTNNVTIPAASSPLKYLVRAETTSPLAGQASDGKDVGANVTKRYGASGTRWGEAGYDQITTQNLWPWPHEDTIKSVFAEPNPAPAGVIPATNNTVRGFTAATDNFGKPMTLTRYIWQYLGNQIPADIYGMVPNSTYVLWQAQQSWNGANSSASADPDSDGITNLMEYAYDTSPVVVNALTAITQAISGNNMTVNYIVNTTKADLNWQLKISTDLTTWTNFTSSLASQSGTQQIWTSQIPMTDTKKFVKLQISN